MKRYTDDERRRLVSEFHNSGLKAAVFSRLCGVSVVSLNTWRRRFAEGPPSSPAVDGDGGSGRWVPVVVARQLPLHEALLHSQPSTSMPIYVLASPSGRLELQAGFDAREVGVLWGILAADSSNLGVAL